MIHGKVITFVSKWENERKGDRAHEKYRKCGEYRVRVYMCFCARERDFRFNINIYFLNKKSEKVFLVNVYKKGRRKYFMDVIVNYILIDILLYYNSIIIVRFFFFSSIISHQGLKLGCKEWEEEIFLSNVFVRNLRFAYIIAYCNYMAILSSLFVLLLTNLIVRN